MTRSLDIDTFANGGKSKANPPGAASLNERLHPPALRRSKSASATADHIPIHIAQELIRPDPAEADADAAMTPFSSFPART
jgi:hypothetical protein